MVAICAIAVLTLSHSPTLHHHGDDTGYLTLGMSLAQGQGFKDISLPIPQHNLWWPSGFPLLIAGVYKMVGPQWALLNIALLLLYFPAVFLFGTMLRRNGLTLIETIAVSIALCMSSAVHLTSAYLYSETFFLSLTLLFFVLFERWKSRITLPRAVLLSVVALYIATIRNIGLALPLSLAFYFVWRSPRNASASWRHAYLIPFGLVIAYLLVSVTVAPLTVGSLQSFLGLLPRYQPVLDSSTVTAKSAETFFSLFHSRTSKIIVSLRGYALTLVPQALLISLYDLRPMSVVKALFFLPVTATVALGWGKSLKKYPLMGIYVFLSFGVLLSYGAHYVRLLVPVAPFLLVYLYLGIRWLVSRIVRPPRRAVAVVVLLWVIVIGDNAWWTFAHPRKYMPANIAGPSYDSAISWIESTATPRQAVMSHVPRYLYVTTGLKSVPFYDARSGGALLDYLDYHHVGYILVDDPSRRKATALREVVASYPDRFVIHKITSTGDASFVYRYLPESTQLEQTP